MLGSLFSHKSGAPVLIADVESGSAAVAVVVPTVSGAAHVVSSSRIDAPIETRTPEQSQSATMNVLSEATKQAVEKYTQSEEGKRLGPVRASYALVGPSLSRSRTIHLEEYYDTERSISDSMIQALAQKALQLPSELDAANILETNVTRVHLNGYSTGKPVGKKTKQLAVTAYQSDIRAGIRQQIEHTLGTYAPGRTVDIRSQTRAILTVLHERTHDSRNYLIITLGNDATHFLTIRKEELTAHATSEMGATKIITGLAGEGGSPETTLTLLRMVSMDACSDEACEKMKVSLAKAEPMLIKAYGEVFAQLSATRRVPNDCILIARSDMAPWLESFFARLDFSQFSITAQPLTVVSLEPEHVQDFVIWQNDVTQDTGIGIAASFVNITLQASS